MTFQVYYRKWRPQRFRELVGQEHVSSTLRRAVQQERVSHSYLFCGPRGTGKTSTARVLAKAVNCPNPEDGDPCNSCAPCLAVNESRFLDLIELDAASNRGIDEIRNIRDRVNLAPAAGGYKVYIIDEAHMLTEHASNAFLKTLEEPPFHAIFILCTTEPHKILPTIISRCQRFDFRHITSEAIVERLRGICLEEGVDVDGEALTALAHSAGGSLRDAENLLEQLAVSQSGHIGISEVHDLLGLGQGEKALEFIRYLLIGNTAAALSTINRAAWDGVDLRQLHRQSVDLLRGVLMLQCGSRDSLDLPQETLRELEDLVPRTSTARVMKSLKLLGEVNMKHDVSSPLPLELAVVEVCMESTPTQPTAAGGPDLSSRPSPTSRPVTERMAAQAQAPTTPQGRNAQPASNPSTVGAMALDEGSSAAATPSIETTLPTSSSKPSQPVSVSEDRSPSQSQEVSTRGVSDPPSSSVPALQESSGALQDQWGELVKTLSRYKGKRFNIGALLRDCKGQSIEGETLVLAFAHRSHLERMQEELDDPQGMKMVSDAFLKSWGTSYQLRLTLVDDDGASGALLPTQSPLVRAALSMGARITGEREQ